MMDVCGTEGGVPEKKTVKGMVFDIKRYSIHDGPGIRTTFFLKGCPLSCWWCHNPEGISPGPVLIRHPGRCIGCGKCVSVCPTGAWSLGENGSLRYDRAACILCRKCAAACPPVAIEIAGREMTAEEVLKEAKKDIPFFDESGGGVTFSGGEPLLQGEFLIECLKKMKEEEIHTAVDTSGFCNTDTLLRASELADLFLFDVKHIDSGEHELYTGVNNAIILENLESLDEALAARGAGRINMRIPVIPGFNDDRDTLARIAGLALTLKTLSAVNLLPYHSAAESKYSNLGMEYKMDKTVKPPEEKMNEAKEIFLSLGIEAVIGG